ncbi:hypothetical protein JTE90_010576 [Oedothorax gibbosus]|uniref:Uncharacterized protein n=1 Tax=Oedothorax gibbosus TaxID=931172 RepID=A0AAV6V6B2_9ARAC|nr:hypothetical protein JTE90_010576 [Oedothorax gibbosus]
MCDITTFYPKSSPYIKGLSSLTNKRTTTSVYTTPWGPTTCVSINLTPHMGRCIRPIPPSQPGGMASAPR